MSKTILVVDDEPDFRASVRDILCLEGYEVIEAENGKKGLPIVEKEDLDLVITDILMPESEGNDFAFNINEIKPELKIIGMTGGGRIGPASHIEKICISSLFEKILHKPFMRDELLAQVEKSIRI